MSISKVMGGLALLGRCMNDPEIMAAVLTNQLELEIKYAFYYMERKELPPSETLEDVNVPEVITAYERLVTMIRNKVQHIFRMAEIEENRNQRIQGHIDEANRKKEIDERLKAQSAPHPLGTTAEISEKYGLSKTAVRKMKADGTLEVYCAAKDALNNNI